MGKRKKKNNPQKKANITGTGQSAKSDYSLKQTGGSSLDALLEQGRSDRSHEVNIDVNGFKEVDPAPPATNRDPKIQDYAHAPFNFIPFTTFKSENGDGKGTLPYLYESVEDEQFPKFDTINDDLKSGYIDFDIRNLTEISMNQGLDNDKQTFYRDANNHLMIPGSTIRGFIRSHCELLSFSYPHFIDDQYFTYRDFAGVDSKRKSQYKERVFGKGDKESNRLEGVQAGILYKSSQKGFESYYIKRVKSLKDSSQTYKSERESKLRNDGYLEKKEHWMYTQILLTQSEFLESEYSDKYNEYRDYLKDYINDKYMPYRQDIDYNGQKCQLLNSCYIDGKQRHYIVAAEPNNINSEPIKVKEKLILAYQNDYKNYWEKTIENFSSDEKKKAYKEFYQLPQEDGLINGKIFFYKTNGSELIGFGPTPYLRIFYDHPATHGIPYENDQEKINYTEALFGFIDDIDEGKGCFKSRLSFRDALIEKNSDPKWTSRVLSEPKGTSLEIYLDDSADWKNQKTYNEDFKLKGYKFYWKESNVLSDQYTKNNNIRSKVFYVDRNNIFHERIFFTNLRDEELGLLLCAIQYKKADDPKSETYMIGKGKPYGFGQIEINNVQLHTYDTKNDFVSVNPTVNDKTCEIESLKKIFKDGLLEKIQENNPKYHSLEDTPTYKTYIAYAKSGNMRKHVWANQSSVYMSLDEYGEHNYLKSAMDILNEK